MEGEVSDGTDNVTCSSESSEGLDEKLQFVHSSEPLEMADSTALPITEARIVAESSTTASQVQTTIEESWSTETDTIYATACSCGDQNYFLLRFVQPKTAAPVLLLANKGTSVETSIVVDGQSSALSQFTQLQSWTTVVNADGRPFTLPPPLKAIKRWTNHSNGGSSREKAPSGEKVYLCEVEGCGRSFTSMGYLRYHQAVHEGQKALKCPFEGCDRKFSWPAHLNYHQLTHTGDRQHECTVEGCGKTFYTAQRLAVHQRTHTGEKPFLCTEVGCDKSFTTAGNLKNHIRVHTGERPYLCDHRDCGVRFAEFSSLKKHKLIHTGEKPFVCEICGRKFTQSGSRKIHMKGHQKSKSVKKKSGRERNLAADKQNVLVLRQADVFHYRDFHSSESVVFSPAATDNVVTVTTQPADGDTDQLDLHQGILGGEEVLTSEDSIRGNSLAETSRSMGANVVVLSQPQDMVPMVTRFQPREQVTQEEVVYGSDLLHSDLDHEEIADDNISHASGLVDQQTSMPQSSSRGDDEVAMDPMMETDDESEGAESRIWVEND